jgi:ABC-type lipoprotein release transport system permease subunit
MIKKRTPEEQFERWYYSLSEERRYVLRMRRRTRMIINLVSLVGLALTVFILIASVKLLLSGYG